MHTAIGSMYAWWDVDPGVGGSCQVDLSSRLCWYGFSVTSTRKLVFPPAALRFHGDQAKAAYDECYRINGNMTQEWKTSPSRPSTRSYGIDGGYAQIMLACI